MCNLKTLKTLIECDSLNEVTISDLLTNSHRKKKIAYKITYKRLNFKTKSFYFTVGDYDVTLRTPDYASISKLKGTDAEKLSLALDSDVKVYCSCPDFKYTFSYMAWQVDYGTRSENRPPNIRNPKLKGSICKHLNYFLPKIDQFETQMLKSIEKARETEYKVVRV